MPRSRPTICACRNEGVQEQQPIKMGIPLVLHSLWPKIFSFFTCGLCENHAAQHALHLSCLLACQYLKGKKGKADLAGPAMEMIRSVQLGKASSIFIRAPVSLRICETISPPCAGASQPLYL